MNAPRGGTTAAPGRFCALFSIDSELRKIIESVEFSFLRSLAFGFCQFLAALGIFSILLHVMAKHAKSIVRKVRLAALRAVVRGLRGQYRQGINLQIQPLSAHAAC